MLRISKLTDYGILVMVELAMDGELLSAQVLAERVHIEIPTASSARFSSMAVRPRHVGVRSGNRHGIESAAAERLAAQQAPCRQPRSAPHTVDRDRLLRVLRMRDLQGHQLITRQ